MERKTVSAIEKIALNDAPFEGTVITPTLINFFYGKNGTGKTTIARAIMSGEGLTWKDGEPEAEYVRLVYGQQFILDNLRNYENLQGVFTISEQDIAVRDAIKEKTDARIEFERLAGIAQGEIDKRKKAASEMLARLKDICWDRAASLRDAYPDIFTGLRSDRTKFVEAVLAGFVEQLKKGVKDRKAAEGIMPLSPVEHNMDEIASTYKAASGGETEEYKEFMPAETGLLCVSNLMQEMITSSVDTPFAQFLTSIAATDWVRQGHERYHEMADGKCPYCSRTLPDNFEADLAACFDDAYRVKLQSLQGYRQQYREDGLQIWQVLSGNLEGRYAGIDTTAYEAKIGEFQAMMKLNLEKIDDKIKEPAVAKVLDDIEAILSEINEMIAAFNAKIRAVNAIIREKPKKLAECKQAILEYALFLLKGDVDGYRAGLATLESEVASYKATVSVNRQQAKSLEEKIAKLSVSNSNTQAAVISMNERLKDSGFLGFYLREKADVPNAYEVVRTSTNAVAKRLSEGERNFIAFLYFYHKVLGSDHAASVSAKKIVVIDDPVSSMDSDVLFIVGALVRNLIEICRNNADYEGRELDGDFIKQIFILTHNTYFHREVAYNYVHRWHCASFFMIHKEELTSNVELCTEPNPKAPSEEVNRNPVQNSYAALWREYREVRTPIAILNVIRRILEYYFLQMCGFEGEDLQHEILEKPENRVRFIGTRPDGSKDYVRFNQAKAMLAYIATNKVGITDGIHYVDDCTNVNQCRETFEVIFDVMEQTQHFRKMMGLQ